MQFPKRMIRMARALLLAMAFFGTVVLMSLKLGEMYPSRYSCNEPYYRCGGQLIGCCDTRPINTPEGGCKNGTMYGNGPSCPSTSAASRPLVPSNCTGVLAMVPGCKLGFHYSLKMLVPIGFVFIASNWDLTHVFKSSILCL